MTARPTDGPWAVYNSSPDEFRQIWHVLERGKRGNDTVATCKGHNAEERAKLIAAAPAMLAALRAARAEIIELADGLGCDHDANICKCSTRELVHTIDAALQQVEG